jgi:predicted ATP-grasp superfamily ATP-dependent carboligase
MTTEVITEKDLTECYNEIINKITNLQIRIDSLDETIKKIYEGVQHCPHFNEREN